jgi:hypothetical protein
MNYYKVTAGSPFAYYMQFEEQEHKGTIIQVNDETGEKFVFSGGAGKKRYLGHMDMQLYCWSESGVRVILVDSNVPNILEPSTEEEYLKIIGAL